VAKQTPDTDHAQQTAGDRAACDLLRDKIPAGLAEAEARIRRRHPVWFLAGNPVVGHSRRKPGIRPRFRSGMDFDEPGLQPGTGRFRDPSRFCKAVGRMEPGERRQGQQGRGSSSGTAATSWRARGGRTGPGKSEVRERFEALGAARQG
jgi:hypothetical protein